MNKKEDRIYITDNPLAQLSLKHDVMEAFEKCAELETLVKDFGLPITREIVTDCLTLKKDVESVPIEGTTKWVGEKSEQERFTRKYAPVEVWRNCEHIRKAFDAMLQGIEEHGGRAADIKQRKEALKSDFDKLLGDIYGLFHTNRRTIRADALLRYFDIENESIVLVPDLDERLKADTSTYATKEEAKAACKLHREIAEQLNKLADLMKNVARYDFVSELDKIFFQSEDGMIQATPIDYDIFT